MQTSHLTTVTDGFHQGGHGLTGEMYMETAAKGADIYLPAACYPGHRKREANMMSLVRRVVVTSVLKAIIEQRLQALYKYVVTGKCNTERRSNPMW